MKFTIGILENLEFIFSFKFLPFLINERSKSPTILFGDQKESSYYYYSFSGHITVNDSEKTGKGIENLFTSSYRFLSVT